MHGASLAQTGAVEDHSRDITVILIMLPIATLICCAAVSLGTFVFSQNS